MASQQQRSHVTWLLFVFWLASRWRMILLTAAGSISGKGFSPQPSTQVQLKQGCIDNYFFTANRYSEHNIFEVGIVLVRGQLEKKCLM